MRRRVKPSRAKVKAKPAVVRKSPKTEGSRVRDLEKRLAEALKREAASSEILRVISRSPSELQPVLDAVTERAASLCEALDASIVLRDGDRMRVRAHYGPLPQSRHALPLPGTVSGRAILDGRTIHVHDAQAAADEFPVAQAHALRHGSRSALATPLVRGGVPIGAILIRRGEVRPFSDQHIALLQTFAAQAVIAIENVRLFEELRTSNRDLTAALEQQAATSEILRAITHAPTDTQPVFDTIVRSAATLCHAAVTAVFLTDGQMVFVPANYGSSPEALGAVRARFPRPLDMESSGGIAILTRSVVHVPDSEEPSVGELVRQSGRRLGFRSLITVPMLRDGAAVGAIGVYRREPGRFSDAEVALLQTFADQAVIAIENVRLFTELQASNRELTTALDQQTATSDILRVISQSQTNAQPVFDAIVESAVHLLRGYTGALTRIAGDQIELAAHKSTDEAAAGALRALFPRSLQSGGPAAQTVRDRAPVNIADAQTDLRLPEAVRAVARTRDYRSWVVVPLLRHDEAVGTISVTRREPGGFTDEEVALLKTFADQAVIAIENVRLFTELQARTGELTQSVEKLTALGEISQAVSSTLDVETVLDTIVSRATQLAGADGCAISEYDDATAMFHVRATHGIDAALVGTLRAMPLHKGEGVMGRAAETREPIQVADIAVPGAYQSHLRDVLIGVGFRAVLSVPLLREDQIIGSLSLNRKAPGEFPPEVVEVLKTFATQSALAIQKARLFREIADKSAQLEAASRHKSEFLANMSRELRTPLNAIIGFSEVLTERMFGELNEKQDEYLKDIYASGQHLLSLINDILDLSKIEAGRMELELADFDLPSAIDNALILVRERASRRGITLGDSVDERLGAIRGDERKVKQVLLNLLSNALKFTPEGGRIDVSAVPEDGMAEISVADSGVGIAPEDQEAVFEEFRQVGTADKKVEGTGLGLALSRKFIELHGGRIWVTSQVGQGSTFTFTLPVRRGE